MQEKNYVTVDSRKTLEELKDFEIWKEWKHNQISIEGRGVIDASGMSANQSGVSGDLIDRKLWKEL